eukprot:CAMPEP_0184695400 /NCGR_PEP_ID=MMETSP0313-20130426/3033_1 /TAXON_ID=2792 /ORGANISM="Porphyridium aerugineum, Strain SAG 1380-2" /LENGTH=852 /DNA_ID=CAMNT_0027153837 /DNA_START=728 /DNA_END=3286 /DNA_ORIENTATION=+
MLDYDLKSKVGDVLWKWIISESDVDLVMSVLEPESFENALFLELAPGNTSSPTHSQERTSTKESEDRPQIASMMESDTGNDNYSKQDEAHQAEEEKQGSEQEIILETELQQRQQQQDINAKISGNGLPQTVSPPQVVVRSSTTSSKSAANAAGSSSVSGTPKNLPLVLKPKVSPISTARLYLKQRKLGDWIYGLVFGTTGVVVTKIFESNMNIQPTFSRYLVNLQTGEYIEFIHLPNNMYLINEIVLFSSHTVHTSSYVVGPEILERGRARILNFVILQSPDQCLYCKREDLDYCHCPLSMRRRSALPNLGNRRYGDFMQLFVQCFTNMESLEVRKFNSDMKMIAIDYHDIASCAQVSTGNKLQAMKRLFVNHVHKENPSSVLHRDWILAFTNAQSQGAANQGRGIGYITDGKQQFSQGSAPQTQQGWDLSRNQGNTKDEEQRKQEEQNRQAKRLEALKRFYPMDIATSEPVVLQPVDVGNEIVFVDEEAAYDLQQANVGFNQGSLSLRSVDWNPRSQAENILLGRGTGLPREILSADALDGNDRIPRMSVPVQQAPLAANDSLSRKRRYDIRNLVNDPADMEAVSNVNTEHIAKLKKPDFGVGTENRVGGGGGGSSGGYAYFAAGVTAGSQPQSNMNMPVSGPAVQSLASQPPAHLASMPQTHIRSSATNDIPALGAKSSGPFSALPPSPVFMTTDIVSASGSAAAMPNPRQTASVEAPAAAPASHTGKEAPNDVSRPHECKLCGARFLNRSHLESHVQCVHFGMRGFQCPEPGCNASFGSRGNLNRHAIMKHSNQKPFLCTVCNRSFATNDKLQRHFTSKQHEARANVSLGPNHPNQAAPDSDESDGQAV